MMRGLALLACVLLTAACAGNSSQSAPTASAVAKTEPSLGASATVSSPPSPVLSPAPTPVASSAPDIYAAQLAASGLPKTVAGNVLNVSFFFDGSVGSLPDTWLITGVVKALGLTKNDVYLFVDAGDSTDPSISLRTMHVVAIGYRGAQPAALLAAFVTAAKSSPQSLCPTCAFTRATIAGKSVVIEDGMPPLRQSDGTAAFPGGRQYAYAHGDVLYGITATTPAVVAEVLGTLP